MNGIGTEAAFYGLSSRIFTVAVRATKASAGGDLQPAFAQYIYKIYFSTFYTLINPSLLLVSCINIYLRFFCLHKKDIEIL